jgi:hypothetical protein
MPLDPTLYPSIPNPIQQVIQRQGSLETRLAALERKRDQVNTPYNILQGQTASIHWYGGRLWASCGGWTSRQSPGAAGHYQLGSSLMINGTPISAFTNPVFAYTPSATDPLIVAVPAMSVEFSASAMASLGATPGGTLTLTAAAGNSATNCWLSGLFLEWPQV